MSNVDSVSEPLSPVADEAATRHLTSLPRMSATAGVGTQEYVAINTAAVLALLLGIASVLALIASILLVIPIVCIITSLIACRQIAHSNDTESGKGVALLGLFISVAITVFVLGGLAIRSVQNRADRQAISTLVEQFGNDMRDRNFDAAYNLFDLRFKSRVPHDAFVDRLRSVQESLVHMGLGPIKSAHWNGLARIDSDSLNGVITAEAEIEYAYQNTDQNNADSARLRKSGNTWLIDNLPIFFTSAK